MRIDVVTLFPDMFNLLSEQGVSSRALKKSCGVYIHGILASTPQMYIALWMTVLMAEGLAW